MYEDLNYNIESCEEDDQVTNNTWSDSVCDYTYEYILKFTEEDWKKLLAELPGKSTMWKRRLIDCLGDPENRNELRALMIMARTEDPELFALVICTLVDFEVTGVEGIDSVFAKAEQMMPQVADYYKPIFAKFLEKKNNPVK